MAAAAILLLAAALPAGARYVRSVARYAPPDVTLVDARGERVRLAAVLDHPGPVLLQFIFTTCPSVCPALSTTLSAAQENLGERVRLVSISIDPEFDTPARLRTYARQFKAGPQWWFLTGSREDVAVIRKAFDAYSANKMSHEPLTFLRPALGAPWVRLAGGIGPADLVEEVRRSSPEVGQRIYRDGLLPSGRPLAATVEGGTAVGGAQLACASCHRRSGFGASEGGVYVPRVTGPALFQPRQLRRADLFRNLYQEVQPKPYGERVRDPRLRPAYTPETLAVALREGRDPAGRTLDPLMPRYRLSDEEAAHLAAYLRGLSAAPSPGVDGEAIHFATVVTEGVDPGRRKAMLDVLEAYVRWKNAETRHSASRLGSSPWYRDEFAGSYREWRLHVWNLRGLASTWPEQLAAHYRAQPVFAVLSGIGAGSWRPVHEFCERAEVPCLFPNTDLPVADPPGAYTLYLSPGLAVEAQALARHLAESPEGRIVQVYRDVDEGRVPAQALRSMAGHLEERAVPPGVALTPAFWKRLVRETRPDVLMLWLGPDDAATLRSATDAFAPVRRIVFSGSLLGEAELDVPAGLWEKAWLTWRFALPGHEEPLIYRVRAWMRARRVERTHERLQLATWFTLAVTDHSLTHIVESFSRDFFVESVEEETENALNPGVFPSLSLGPGQRFASKGSYVVRLAAGGLEAVDGWIVP
ncbi:MAG TPA: SCO family protein [Thermoanaerobaculia bacterium]|jgi:cytochrome oxidase Cu insertion factor (SCO1/SenC/PrrC family)